MDKELKNKIAKFQAATGLGDHRVGILLADNGHLLPRIRSGGRVWPETVRKIKQRINSEADARGVKL